MISFSTTPAEGKIIRQIVDRAQIIAADLGADPIDTLSLTMDLSACHANGNPLDFERLLAADRFNFVHDVWGIMRHMDRDTGKLGDCFLPRFSVSCQRARDDDSPEIAAIIEAGAAAERDTRA